MDEEVATDTWLKTPEEFSCEYAYLSWPQTFNQE
jgi:hypothetical protein